jgi:spermidine/putrescine-binding protein
MRFILPKEGTFIAIENLAIPSHSKKEALTYKFINYLFKESSVRTHFTTYGYFPSTLQSLHEVELSPEAKSLLFSSEEQFKKFHFMHEVMPQQTITDIWVEVKSGKY